MALSDLLREFASVEGKKCTFPFLKDLFRKELKVYNVRCNNRIQILNGFCRKLSTSEASDVIDKGLQNDIERRQETGQVRAESSDHPVSFVTGRRRHVLHRSLTSQAFCLKSTSTTFHGGGARWGGPGRGSLAPRRDLGCYSRRSAQRGRTAHSQRESTHGGTIRTESWDVLPPHPRNSPT